MVVLFIVVVLVVVVVVNIFTDKTDNKTIAANNLILGRQVFNNNCAKCHGYRAKGLVSNWKAPLPSGKYPAPLLNGSAHSWHHSPKLLLNTINYGGAKLGGTMPSFKDKLTQVEKQAVIKYIKSLWPETIKRKYNKRFN